MFAFAPNGVAIRGSFEVLTGRAEITIDKWNKGEPEFEGDTEIFYDEQATVENEEGEGLFLDRDGDCWPEASLLFSEHPEGEDLTFDEAAKPIQTPHFQSLYFAALGVLDNWEGGDLAAAVRALARAAGRGE